MRNVIFCGGGSAGHVMPNIALMRQLKDKCNCLYVGTNGIEKQIVTDTFGREIFFEITCQKLLRKFTLKNITLPFAIAKSIKQCKQILKQTKPVLVFAKGGYASFPVVYAAKKLKIPIFIHESDFTMGLANKLCAKWCDKIFTTFEDTAKMYKNAYCVGSPIRQQIYKASKSKGLATMRFENNNRKKITIIGGSLGAKRLNQIIFDNQKELSQKYDVFIITGKGKKDDKAKYINQAEFVSNVFDVFCASNLVIARSGSNVICELASLGKPMILVPLTQATRGEQAQNASYFFDKGCCIIADENTLDKHTLFDKIDFAFANADSMKQNQKKLNIDGTDKIVMEILKILDKK